jgi:hypothetical protein
MDQNGEEEP